MCLGAVVSLFLCGAVGGCGSGGAQSGAGESAASREARTAPRRSCGHPHVFQQTIATAKPAKIAPHGDPAVAGLLSHETNGWSVQTHHEEVTVVAGAVDARQTTGGFEILRYDPCARPSVLADPPGPFVVEVAGSGPLTITRAPTGFDVGPLPGRTGRLHFKGAKGARGILDLNGATATCEAPGRACEQVTPRTCAPVVGLYGIRAWDMGCASAREFARRTFKACVGEGDLPCARAGFHCHEAGGPYTDAQPIWCQRGPQRLEGIWGPL